MSLITFAQHDDLKDSVATKADILGLEVKMRELELRMTIKLGTLIFVATGLASGLVIAAIRMMFGSSLP